ncbi:hypothetical protein D3C77_153630 [compost metagenome]
MHDIVARFLPGVPAATCGRLGCRLLDRFCCRLGRRNLGRRRLGHRCNRLAGDRCNRLRRRGDSLGLGHWLRRSRCRAGSNASWRGNGGDGRRLQRGITSRASLFAITHAGGLGQRAAHHRLRLTYQRQWHWLRISSELNRRAAIVRLCITWLALAQWQLRLLCRRGWRLIAFLRHQHRRGNGDHNDSRQCQHVFLRHIEPH